MNNRANDHSAEPVSRETMARLEVYEDLLRTWQAKTNLIANSTLSEIRERHVKDSLQCLELIPFARHWLDLGSGGGLPGLVIAAAMADHPESAVTLVESNSKKCAFLRQANRKMGCRATIMCERIENIDALDYEPQVVTARALAPLRELLGMAERWLVNGATGLFHKGREYRAEIEECNGLWQFDLVSHQSRIAPDSVILEITNLTSAKS